MECEPWAPRTVERLLGSGLERPIGKHHPGAARLPVGGSSAAGLSTGHESASETKIAKKGSPLRSFLSIGWDRDLLAHRIL